MDSRNDTDPNRNPEMDPNMSLARIKNVRFGEHTQIGAVRKPYVFAYFVVISMGLFSYCNIIMKAVCRFDARHNPVSNHKLEEGSI